MGWRNDSLDDFQRVCSVRLWVRSDKDDDNDPVDVAKAEQQGLIGLPPGSGLFTDLRQGQLAEIADYRVRRL